MVFVAFVIGIMECGDHYLWHVLVDGKVAVGWWVSARHWKIWVTLVCQKTDTALSDSRWNAHRSCACLTDLNVHVKLYQCWFIQIWMCWWNLTTCICKCKWNCSSSVWYRSECTCEILNHISFVLSRFECTDKITSDLYYSFENAEIISVFEHVELTCGWNLS